MLDLSSNTSCENFEINQEFQWHYHISETQFTVTKRKTKEEEKSAFKQRRFGVLSLSGIS